MLYSEKQFCNYFSVKSVATLTVDVEYCLGGIALAAEASDSAYF